tara:strand:+ start:459 stop:851 length:393 start_codon:yes stop_codon:yes gene_type:complete
MKTLCISILLLLSCSINEKEDNTVEFKVDGNLIREKLGKPKIKKDTHIVVERTKLVPRKETRPEFIDVKPCSYVMLDEKLIVLEKRFSKMKKYKYIYIVTDGMYEEARHGFALHSNKEYVIGDKLILRRY